jgi:TonB-linked SusC/RagA family outer membrane protein
MRITTIILFAAIMQVSASSFAQRVTLIKKDITLDEFFREIRKQTGYNVSYSDKVIDDAKRLNVNFQSTPLEQALTMALQDQKLYFEISDKDITISKKIPSFLERLADRWAAIDVHGRVVDTEGKPLPGATVKVKRTSKSFSTNANGEFYLEKLDGGEILVISFIGYVNKEVKAEKDMGSIVLEVSLSKLDEVQVIAYGTTTRRLSTGNVSSVTAEEIGRQPVNNPLLALAGRVPGLVISQSTGFSGSGVQVQIQGQNSLRNGNDPFYVIDGIPYISQLLPNLGTVLGSPSNTNRAQRGNPLSFINPQDIESIEVLKDADATSIYGSRAANGAILITTKKGKSGETRVDLNIQSGFGEVARKLKLLNTQQYIEVRKEAYNNDGVPIPTQPTSGVYDLTFWDQNRYTDWQKELIGNTAHYNDAQLSISGGANNFNYRAGGGYHKETTVFPTDKGDQKASIHFNLNSKSNNQKFHFSLTGNYLLDNNNLLNADFTFKAMTLAPNTPSLLNADGSLNWAPTNSGVSSMGFAHPLGGLKALYKNKTSNLLSHADLSYEILSGLEIKGSFGYNNLQTDELVTNPSSIFAPEFRSFMPISSQYGNNNINSWIAEPKIHYNRTFNRSKLDALLGVTVQQSNSSRKLIEASGFANDLVMENINAATSISVPSNTTILSVYRYNALFGRFNYNLQDKYILNLSWRRDGTSRFGKENRFHNFGAIGAAWLFGTETVVIDQIPFLSFGKLSVSYGTTGSDQIDDYAYLSIYNNNNPEVPYGGGGGLFPSKLPNPYLQWEEVRKLSTSLDLGILKDRLLFNMTYFRNRSSNQLLSYSLPPSVGFGSIESNFPATIQNSGWEVSMNTSNVTTKDFNWRSGFNVTLPKNKLIAYKDLENSPYANVYKIGQPITTVNLYKGAGINSNSGTYEVIDRNGNRVLNPGEGHENKIKIINVAQTFYGGFQNSFSYKGISLEVFIQFVKQMGPSYYFGGSMPGQTNVNLPITILDRWQKIGDEKTVQKYTLSDSNLITAFGFLNRSDISWIDASYVRLKNVSLSWQIPELWSNKIHFQKARIYLQGQNLLTATKYDGLDPESKSSSTLPPLRVLTFGVQVTL